MLQQLFLTRGSACYRPKSRSPGDWEFSLTEHFVPQFFTYELYKLLPRHFRNTLSNDPKARVGYSDFIPPDDWPNFLNPIYINKYHHMYADHFGLFKYIKLRHEVLGVTKADDFSTSGAWKVKVKDCEGGEIKEEEFDFVMVCSGMFRKTYIPNVCSILI